jgi:two-component system NtrC family sensor kinase
MIVDETAIGVMEAINKSTGEFDAHDLDLMQAMASSAAVAIENARMYEAQRDYTHRLQAAQPQLIQTEKMAALGRLTASMAHEINNPLQVVQGCLSLVQDALDAHNRIDVPARDAIKQDLSTAMHEVERLAALVQHLHRFYQPIRTSAKSSDVHDLIGRVLELTEQQIVANHIAVKLVLELERVRPRPRVAANPDHLMQALLNLVLGAIDSMADGGQLIIRTALDNHLAPAGVSAESRICIDISDSGAAIPAASLPYAFEPFHAVRPNDSGLSLSICYELITSLGGEITVTSQAGLGTTFTLWLPIELIE